MNQLDILVEARQRDILNEAQQTTLARQAVGNKHGVRQPLARVCAYIQSKIAELVGNAKRPHIGSRVNLYEA